MSEYVSTVIFRSNLQPAGDLLIQDEYFHSKIHDPFSLPVLKKNAYLTLIQQEEFKNISTHCAYADKNEFPYGTVRDENGKLHVVCRCTNLSCPHLSRCNPSADPESIKRLQQENLLTYPKIQRFYSKTDFINEDHMSGKTSVTPVLPDISATHLNNVTEPVEPVTESADNPATTSVDPVHIPNISPDISPTPVSADPFVIGKKSAAKQEKVQIIQSEGSGFDRFRESSQQEIILTPINDRTIVNAGPGTGKTWTLIEKIIHILNENEDSAENILVLCFSKAAVDVIKKRLSVAAEEGRTPWAWHNVDIRTFDSFSTYMLSELLPDDFHLERLDYDARIQQATDLFLKQDDILADYEHIIVDEVQDLVGYRAQLVIEMLKSLPSSCGFTLLGDACQSLYDYVSVNNPTLISSEEFYRLLFENFPDIHYYSLTQNHRQNDELGHMTIPYRKAILTGSADERQHAAAEILSLVEPVDLKFQHFQKEDAIPYLQNGTLGILTRTNAQALQISSWLRTNEVPHLLQRAKGTPPLSSWICSVFFDYPHKTINESAFIAQYLKKYPDSSYEDAQMHWVSLVDCQPGEPASHYEVEDLLKGLLHSPKDSLLYEAPDDNEFAITVSTVHRAKGGEYDSVLVLEDVLSAKSTSQQDELLEHKICYVALTRPRKQIQSVQLPTQYIYTAKNETRRCFRAGGYSNKKYLSHFEVGQEKDILHISSAEEKKRQEYIQNNLKPGSRLRLIRCPEAEYKQIGYIRYKLVPEENHLVVLAYTSPDFAHEMENAIRTIYGNPNCEMKYKYYPGRFSDIYVDRLTTHIAVVDHPLEGAAAYGDIQIWTSFTVNGFAASERDLY